MILKYFQIGFFSCFLLMVTNTLGKPPTKHYKDSVAYTKLARDYSQTKEKHTKEIELLADSLASNYKTHLLQAKIHRKNIKINRGIIALTLVVVVLLLCFLLYIRINKIRKQLKKEYSKAKLLTKQSQQFYQKMIQKQKRSIQKEKEKNREVNALTIQTYLVDLLENKQPIPTQEILAKEINISSNKLRNIIVQNTKWNSFNHFIGEMRVKHAVNQIHKNPNINLLELSKSLFISYNTFKLHFTKYMGVSPKVYKKIGRKGGTNETS